VKNVSGLPCKLGNHRDWNGKPRARRRECTLMSSGCMGTEDAPEPLGMICRLQWSKDKKKNEWIIYDVDIWWNLTRMLHCLVAWGQLEGSVSALASQVWRNPSLWHSSRWSIIRWHSKSGRNTPSVVLILPCID